MAGNSPFRGIVFCNVGTSKTVITKFVTTWQILLPHIFPHMVTPKMFPWDKKASRRKKHLGHKCINSLVSHKLSHNRYLWFFWGTYRSLPDSVIWWCLRTGGGGILTRDNHGGGNGEGEGNGDRKCRPTAIMALGEHPPRSLQLRLWLRSRR